MSSENLNQLVQTNPDFKRLMWQAILVRNYAPMATVTLQLHRLRLDVKVERDVQHITDQMHDYVLAVLNGQLIPADES